MLEAAPAEYTKITHRYSLAIFIADSGVAGNSVEAFCLQWESASNKHLDVFRIVCVCLGVPKGSRHTKNTKGAI